MTTFPPTSTKGYIGFVFLTGISKFSKVGVFSGLNHLNDITMDNRFSALLGITKEEVKTWFQNHIKAFAENEGMPETALLERIQSWYDGFCFSRRCEPVYNPFSLLLLLEAQEFRNYWFESGAPTFLIQLIRERNYDVQQIEDLKLNELGFSSYEIEDLKVAPLLFQTGYLTIKGYEPEKSLYRLDYPNYEVENAFLERLLGAFSHVANGIAGAYLWRLVEALQARDLERFFEVLNVFFADIPYDLQLKQEKYYQTIFYLIFKLIGLKVEAKVKTSRGRIDAVIELEERIFIFEFKLEGSAAEALKQIRNREYFAPYRLKGKPLHLVGVNFEMEARGIGDWQTETHGAT